MNTDLINILQTSPTFSYQNSLEISDTLAIRYLVFSFDLILLSTLNHAKLKQIPLFSFLLDQFYSEVKLIVQNDFDFFHMRYNTAINMTYPTAYVNTTSVQADNYYHDQTRSQSIIIKYKLQGNQQIFTPQKLNITINFGYLKIQEHNHFGRFMIQDFHYLIMGESGNVIKSSKNKKQQRNYLRTNALVQVHENSQSNQNPSLQNYNEQSGSFPVVYLNEYNNLKYDGSQEYFDQLIKNLQPYNATNTTIKQDHLFISHDMKSGYAEDVKFSNNLLFKRSNSYRFNYLWHTGIFNYFSHKTISIPPRHWRQLSKKYQIKCLGTFIVQGMKINQTYYLSNEFALKLVYLAKKHRFDGYLLNIENQIKNISKLKTWLTFLTQRIHEEIPGSMISWYDSIDEKGAVDYQNEVNDRNKIFYQLTDSFFTNYWWNDDKLKDDIKQAQPNKPIYVGNDLWGRGTFGGGEFFTFKGINEIEKFNKPNEPNLVPALFAPGYTYETGGQNSNAYFKANEDRLYRGVIFDKTEITKWESVEQTHLSGLSLDEDREWHTGYYSQNLWTYKTYKKLRVNFLFGIKENATANPSIKTFDYKVTMRVRDIRDNKIIELGTTVEQVNVQLSKTNIIRHMEMFIDGESITPNSNVQIIVATTVEKVLDHESRLIAMYDEQLDWVKNLPMTNVKFIKPFNTYFNVGHGEHFFFKGKQTLQSYDYLADYDLPQTLAINHPFKTSIQHHDAYIGGSSLVVNEQTVDLFSMEMPSTQYNYPISYEVKIASKGGPIDSLYFSQSSGFSIFLDKTSENRIQSGWVEETFELSKDSMKKMKKKFFKQLQTMLTVSVKAKCTIGQVHLRPKMLDDKQPEKPKIQLILSQSFKTSNKDQIYLSIKLNQMAFDDQDQSPRYLIKIDDEYAGFMYLERDEGLFRGKLDQIPIKMKKGKSQVSVTDVDLQLKDQILLEDSGLELAELKHQELSHKIRLTNY